jgi:hypothetical protein
MEALDLDKRNGDEKGKGEESSNMLSMVIFFYNPQRYLASNLVE